MQRYRHPRRVPARGVEEVFMRLSGAEAKKLRQSLLHKKTDSLAVEFSVGTREIWIVENAEMCALSDGRVFWRPPDENNGGG